MMYGLAATASTVGVSVLLKCKSTCQDLWLFRVYIADTLLPEASTHTEEYVPPRRQAQV